MRFWMLALGIALLFDSRFSAAQTQRDDEPRDVPVNPSAPEHHFERALEHYRAGRYRAAVQALNAAIVLDPESKDLFYNLAIVYEKLGQLDLAIVAVGRYIELERDPAEVKRAGLTIARLRGAKAELAVPEIGTGAPSRVSSAPLAPPAAPVPRERRVDGWILGGTALSAAAAFVAIVFSARALALSGEGSTEAFREENQKKVDQSARIANIALSAGLLAGTGTALLWFMRGREDCPGTATGVGVSFRGKF